MEKRVTLAVILCVVFAGAWMFVSDFIFPHPPAPPPVAAEATQKPAAKTESEPAPTPEAPVPAAKEAPRVLTHEAIHGETEERTTVDTNEFRAVFSNLGASLRSLRLKKWTRNAGQRKDDPDAWIELIREVEPKRPSMVFLDPISPDDLRSVLWKAEPEQVTGGVHRLSYVFTSGAGLTYTKTFEVADDRQDVSMHVEVTNPDDAALAGKDRKFTIVGPSGIYPEGAELNFPMSGVFGFEDPRGTLTFAKFALADVVKVPDFSHKAGEDRLQWAAVLNKYFAAIIGPVDPSLPGPKLSSLDSRRLSDEKVEGKLSPDSPLVQFDAGLSYLATIPAVGKSIAFDVMLYAGPRKKDVLDVPRYQRFLPIVDAVSGSFCGLEFVVLPLSKGLVFVLQLLHMVTGNWGIAIILLTALVKVSLFPLTSKQMVAMNRQQTLMAKYKPELDRIREKYKNNKQKQSEETLKFYKEKGLNLFPLGGCLPLLVTMPVFMGLFYIFNSTIELRQAGFVGWINDLAKPDELIAFAHPITILPCLTFRGLNLLPIVMGAIWFWQQKMQPKPADPQMAQQQQMMAFMPIMMTFVLYGYASGLSLYWITNSALGIVEQKVIRAKFIPKPT